MGNILKMKHKEGIRMENLGIDYTWEKINIGLESMWTMHHTSRLQITITKFLQYRVWDTEKAETVAFLDTLEEAQTKAEAYYQIQC